MGEKTKKSFSELCHDIKKRKNPKDKFYTPEKLSIELIDLIPLEFL